MIFLDITHLACEVKKICEHLGLTVNRLIRIAFGPFQLGDLERGGIAEVPAKVLAEQLGRKISLPDKRPEHRKTKAAK